MEAHQLLSKSHLDRAGILGFVLGESFVNVRPQMLELHKLGFSAPPTSVSAEGHVEFERTNAQGKSELVTLSFDSQNTLDTVTIVVEGDSFTDAATAKASAAKLVDAAIKAMGTPSIELNEVESWANEGGYTDASACAYVGCWTGQPVQHAAPKTPHDYLSLVHAAPGPLTSVNVTAGSDDTGRAAVLMLQVRR